VRRPQVLAATKVLAEGFDFQVHEGRANCISHGLFLPRSGFTV
jgi:hypothetical protein